MAARHPDQPPSARRPRGRHRARNALGATVLAGGVAGVVFVALAPGTVQASGPARLLHSALSPAKTAKTAPRADATAATTEPVKAPGEPAKVCGVAKVLDGPAKAPDGAVKVSTSTDLDQATRNHPAGTTFWLTPGVHTLGKGRYTQVQPKDGNRYVGAPGAILDGRHDNQYAFTGNATNVKIRYLTIRNFGKPGETNNEGVVNHDSASHWTIDRSTISGNAGAGLMIGSHNRIFYSCLKGNGQYGFNAYHSKGVLGVVLSRNEIAGNNTDDWEKRQPGCGCTGGGKFWETTSAAVRYNYVHDNHGPGLWADTNNAGFAFEGNYISDNEGEGVFYETSYNARINGNTFVRNGLKAGPKNGGFPTPAIYLSESGGDSRVSGKYGKTLDVTNNRFTDNWSGVVLWENADRFAGSPANSSTGAGTRVNKSVTAKTCNSGTIAKKPYFDDCRWKTQHVNVEHNTFSLDRAKAGTGCTAAKQCGWVGVFSNYGTYPSWSPYKRTVVEENITFKQHNVFSDNTYQGPWHFMGKELGHEVSWSAWRAAPYHQDAGSSKP